MNKIYHFIVALDPESNAGLVYLDKYVYAESKKSAFTKLEFHMNKQFPGIQYSIEDIKVEIEFCI